MGESRPKHSPKYQMKHRLIGAAVIITGALSVLLLLLREPVQMPVSEVATNEAATNGGEAETPVFESNLVPLNVSSVNLNDKESGSTENSLQSQPEKGDGGDQKLVNDQDPADHSPDVSDEALSGWSVRVGTFTKQENVERLFTLLGDHGFDARRTRVQVDSGEATRVWLGPYAKRETADTVNARLHALRGEKGYITKHEP